MGRLHETKHTSFTGNQTASRRSRHSETTCHSIDSCSKLNSFLIHIFIIVIICIRPLSASRESQRYQQLPSHPLLGNTDDTASGTSASVASLLALLVAALAEVVGAGVDNDGAAEDALGADQLDVLVGDSALGVALGVGLEVAQVADVALAVGGSTVGLVVGVDWEGGRLVDGGGWWRMGRKERACGLFCPLEDGVDLQ